MSEATVTDFTPTPTGLDYFFLADTESGHHVVTIGDMIRVIEDDAFYPGETGRMDTARIYLVVRGRVPASVQHQHETYNRDEDWTYKVMRIYSQTGELIAQHAYKVPTLKNYQAWKSQG